ncbi:MAG: DeoR/GlpR family DNA-binding transcription regulator [Anaerolineales bacterium]|nr:DeoR/GlpR family DNA-binding transcription regulator [Anaerolineales bacterium]MDW8161535.1 DeoR/GlpR family DNA-binding transcription regulator [Anaerolineales bacterium]
MSGSSNLSNIERQEQIVQLLSRQKRVTVNDLCEAFSISKATARRDLEVLASQGKIQRVHGGAILVSSAPPEMPILQRQSEQAEEKRQIGIAAAQLVSDGSTVFLGSGSTVLEVARNLRDRRNLTVVTNSLPVINIFADVQDITLVVIGGLFRKSELSFIGHLTEQALREINVDQVIMGARAISLTHGLTNDYLPETMTDRAIIQIGRRVILVVDHTKFGRISTAFLAPLDAIHVVVTDSRTPRSFCEGLEARGIQVIRAGSERTEKGRVEEGGEEPGPL